MQGLKSYGSKIHAVDKVLDKVQYQWHSEHHAYAKCGYLGFANDITDDVEITCKKCLKKIEKENKNENTR
jgi:hypothetical protein